MRKALAKELIFAKSHGIGTLPKRRKPKAIQRHYIAVAAGPTHTYYLHSRKGWRARTS